MTVNNRATDRRLALARLLGSRRPRLGARQRAALTALLPAAVVACVCPAPLHAEAVRAKTDSGIVVGDTGGQVEWFKGIPYARPPVGPLRWRPPEPPAPWKAPLQATRFGPSCPQGADLRNLAPDSGAARTSEDCLTLNVWAPRHPAKPLPVMVWLHGGGNEVGGTGDVFFDGSAFARDGIVLVSANYRLGALGFFAHPALTREAGKDQPLADYGLMDQIAALRWVRRNVSAFGGNPSDVTLFGESAGGEDVLLLMTAPSARGLFGKAIVESGGGWNHLTSLTEAEKSGVAIAAKIGLEHATSAQLRAVPAGRLVALGGDDESGPAVDGRLLPESPLASFRAGHAADVPLIIGTNGDEGVLLGRSPPDPASLFSLAPQDLETLRGLYDGEAANDARLSRALWRDGFFTAPSRWIAAHEAGGAPAYLYRFDYVLSLLRSRRPGAYHGSEIPYVFESWRLPLLAADDQAMTRALHGCWVAFAKTGVPACPGVPAWPPYDPARDLVMHFGDRIEVVPCPDRAALELLTRRLPSLDGSR
jgi:para-nitrobenzyl esterase